MTSKVYLQVSARLEKSVACITGPPTNAEEEYEQFEMTAISILDSESFNYPDGELYLYLLHYLKDKRRQLGLKPLD